MRLSESQKAGDGDVFVKRFPMNAEAAADQRPVITILWRCVLKARIPFERDGDLAAIGQLDLQHLVCAGHVYCQRLYLNCRNAHNSNFLGYR